MAKKRDAVKAILADLRRAFGKLKDEDRKRLWDVLSALRGPDEENRGELKDATTAIIRGAVFGHTLLDAGFAGFAVVKYADSDSFAALRKEMTNSHFETHIKWAFETLGLSVTENNGQIKLVR